MRLALCVCAVCGALHRAAASLLIAVGGLACVTQPALGGCATLCCVARGCVNLAACACCL